MASVTTEPGGGSLQAPATTVPKKSTSTPSSSASTAHAKQATEIIKADFRRLVKPCYMYKDEYKDCKSFKARFHQYFVDGKSAECDQWKTDYENCQLWEDDQDSNALQKVIESEKVRIKERLKAHYANNVWEHRSAPPEDWNKPLPPSIKEEYKNTFLARKADELKNGTERLGDFHEPDEEAWSCSIM